MGDLKPIGSEKLTGKEKINRILELTYYDGLTDKPKKEHKYEHVCETVNGYYGIDKEKDGFYVKKGLTEEKLDYIGGMFMKKKNRFNSYGEAVKRLELLRAGDFRNQQINEDTKYVLKKNKPESEESTDDLPPEEPEMDIPTNSESDFTPEEPEMGGEPTDELPPEEPEMDELSPEEPEMDGDIEGGELKDIQTLTGKLGQALRDYENEIEPENIKFVINSILSAVDTSRLSNEDKDEIFDYFESNNDIGVDDIPDEDIPDEDLDETMDNIEKTINTPLDFDDGDEINDELDMENYSDDVEEKEINVDELTDYITNNIKTSLSSYFE